MEHQEEEMRRLRELYRQLPKRKQYGVTEKEFMLEMSDGTRLRTVCWTPRGKDSFSVVVTRSCYPKQETEFRLHGEEYAGRGFGFVVQWCRGVNGSEGEWEPNVHERQDGLDTMNYLAARPEIKNIGYWGNSYLAYNGWCMADAVPEKVKSMYLGVYGTDRYTSVYQDGLFRQDIFTHWAMDNAGVKIDADYLTSCRYRPQTEVDEALWGTRLDWYREWITNTDRDSDYWSRQGFWKALREIPGKLKIPVFIREGWFDHHLGGAIEAWNGLSKESGSCSTLQIGPWRHNYDYVLEGQCTEHVADDRISSPFRWFEETLEEERRPGRQCHLYMVGADTWLKRQDMPGKGSEKEILYLDVRSMEEHAGALAKSCREEGRLEYTYDPDDPVMSHGAESCFKSTEVIGSILQPECGYREDVISFVSQPYEEPLSIFGNMEVRLYVSSDAEDTAFTAKVMEVFEDGRCVNIRGNITTLAYRNGRTRRDAYLPGEVEEISIIMWPIAWRLHKNSRIRVDVSSSDFPQYAVHSNYPGIWSRQRACKKARQTIYTGGTYNSRLIIPTI